MTYDVRLCPSHCHLLRVVPTVELFSSEPSGAADKYTLITYEDMSL